VRAATKAAAAAAAAALAPPEGENRRTSHKAAEQKRRDSLKAGFDELRLLLPPINTEALDPESGEPIPGSSAPRLLPKSSLVPDDNPNRGVSKVALLKFSNEYIVKLHERVSKRDDFIERLRDEIRRLCDTSGLEGDDELLDVDIREGEEDFDGPPELDDEDEDDEDDDADGDGEGDGDDDGDVGMDEDDFKPMAGMRKSNRREAKIGKSPVLPLPLSAMAGRRPSMTSKSGSSGTTVTLKFRKGE